MGIALQGYGVSAHDAAGMSEQLVNRSADIAKVFGTDTETVLGKVTSAMRGRTQGVKDYGVEIAKGSDTTAIFNQFMAQTAETAGRSDTTMATFHATMGDLTATLGQALIPVIMALMPLVQGIADWATNNHAAFVAIVLVLSGLALIFGVAATAAGIFAAASLAAVWPILLVVAGIVALVAIIVLVIKYWGDLVGWLQTAISWVDKVIDKLGILVLAFGPIGAVILVIENFSTAWNLAKTAVDAVHDAVVLVWDIANNAATSAIDGFKNAWDGVKKAVNAVHDAISSVWDLAGKVADKIGGIISKIPGLHSADATPPPAAPGATAYGASPYAAPVSFAPTINISGDIGDPTLAGRRIVAALEAWTASNGRRRIAALVGP